MSCVAASAATSSWRASSAATLGVQIAHLEQRLGDHRAISGEPRLLFERSDRPQPVGQTADATKHAHLREPSAQPDDVIANRRIAGRLDHLAQQRQVRPEIDLAQRRGGADRVPQDLGVRLAEHLHQRLQGLEPLLQAGHAQVEDLG
jgi:hypothetical protein